MLTANSTVSANINIAQLTRVDQLLNHRWTVNNSYNTRKWYLSTDWNSSVLPVKKYPLAKLTLLYARHRPTIGYTSILGLIQDISVTHCSEWRACYISLWRYTDHLLTYF